MRVFDPVLGIQPDMAQQLADANGNIRCVVDQPICPDWFGNDIEDPPARIQAGIGVLKDHLQFLAKGCHCLAAGISRDGIAFKLDLAAGWLVQAHDQPGNCRFSATGFADD